MKKADGRFHALVAMDATAAGFCLGFMVVGKHAKHDRLARREIHIHDALRSSAAHVVEVGGFPADDAPNGDDAIDVFAVGVPLGAQGELVAARHRVVFSPLEQSRIVSRRHPIPEDIWCVATADGVMLKTRDRTGGLALQAFLEEVLLLQITY